MCSFIFVYSVNNGKSAPNWETFGYAPAPVIIAVRFPDQEKGRGGYMGSRVGYKGQGLEMGRETGGARATNGKSRPWPDHKKQRLICTYSNIFRGVVFMSVVLHELLVEVKNEFAFEVRPIMQKHAPAALAAKKLAPSENMVKLECSCPNVRATTGTSTQDVLTNNRCAGHF